MGAEGLHLLPPVAPPAEYAAGYLLHGVMQQAVTLFTGRELGDDGIVGRGVDKGIDRDVGKGIDRSVSRGGGRYRDGGRVGTALALQAALLAAAFAAIAVDAAGAAVRVEVGRGQLPVAGAAGAERGVVGTVAPQPSRGLFVVFHNYKCFDVFSLIRGGRNACPTGAILACMIRLPRLCGWVNRACVVCLPCLHGSACLASVVALPCPWGSRVAQVSFPWGAISLSVALS